MMKKMWMGLMVLGLVFAAGAADEETVATVAGNRVSLRAAPDLNAVLLDRAMSGDRLVLADNSNADWVGVVPPDSIDLWVLGEHLDGGTVRVSKLNVRSGPSLSHSAVGVVTNGTAVTVRGEVSGWIRIAPPPGTTVWISRRYVELPEPELPVVEDVETEESVPQIVEKEQMEEPIEWPDGVNVVIEPVGPSFPDVLVADEDQEQGIESEFRGILQPASGQLYKLVSPQDDETVICYVRGNADQMERLDGKEVYISGPVYWAKGLDTPLVRPEQIKLRRRPGQLRQPDQSRL